jgi:hypothetical protein
MNTFIERVRRKKKQKLTYRVDMRLSHDVYYDVCILASRSEINLSAMVRILMLEALEARKQANDKQRR